MRKGMNSKTKRASTIALSKKVSQRYEFFAVVLLFFSKISFSNHKS